MGSVSLEGFGGGGGTSLNFKVVGNPQPETAKENTIWVDTDTEITSWVFSATEPETALDGMVWISTGTSSPVEFNALKKNGITVYPISAKQYVGGVWMDKDAKTYQNGEWVEWIPEGALYWHGNEFEDITGGFTVVSQGTLQKEASQLSFTGTVGTFECFANVKAIPKGSAKKLSVNITSSGGIVRIGVHNSRTATWTNWAIVHTTNAMETGTFELNITNAPSAFYLHIGCGVGTGSYTFKVNEIRMY